MRMPIDQAARDEALEARVNLLIEAGAGTGKTTLLVERVVETVVHRQVPLSRILLITFMDKAQEEMRHRLQARLQERLESAQEWARPLLEAALASLPDAHITTIHGYCQRLLREFGSAYGIPLGFQVMDAVDTDRLWEETFRDWVQDPEREPVVLDLLHAGIGWPHLRRWAKQICEWWDVPDLNADFPNLWGFVAEFRDAAAELAERARLDASPADPGRTQIQDINRQIEWLAEMPRREWPRMLAQWTRGLAPKGNKKNWAHPDWLTEQKEWVQSLREALAQIRQQMADAYLAEWVSLIGREFRPLWRRQRFGALSLTFDDLLIEAERITRRPEVRQALANRFDLVMVDEFQDTDALQAAVIRRLVSPIGEDHLHPHDQGRLFLVGDPKQSIYRFRGADVETYASVRREVEETGGRLIPITQNFRSVPAVLDFVNQLFEARWPLEPNPEVPYIPPFRALDPHFPDDDRTRLRVEQLCPAGSAAEKRRAEAEDIADVIERALGEGWPVRDGRGERPILPEDIALIIPQRTGLDIYRQTLESRHIPVAAQAGRNFFQQDEIRGLFHLFQALANPEDALAAAGWLLSPWVGLTHQELADHRLKGGSWRYGETDHGHPAVLKWWHRLKSWHDKFWRVDAETVLDWAMAASALPAVLERREDRAALANLRQMRELCRDFGDRWGIFEFARWFSGQVLDEVPFDEARVPGRESEVAVSTVHQAKGLEWPFVIVANWKPKRTALDSGIHYNPRLGAVALRQEPWMSREWARLEDDHRRREEAEGDRLLYVALTRARDYLWFYASFLDERFPSESPVEGE
jgi:ATP-dependent helicase/nuclease subunit A